MRMPAMSQSKQKRDVVRIAKVELQRGSSGPLRSLVTNLVRCGAARRTRRSPRVRNPTSSGVCCAGQSELSLRERQGLLSKNTLPKTVVFAGDKNARFWHMLRGSRGKL